MTKNYFARIKRMKLIKLHLINLDEYQIGFVNFVRLTRKQLKNLLADEALENRLVVC